MILTGSNAELTIDGKTVGTLKSVTFETPEPDPALVPIDLEPIEGTFRAHVPNCRRLGRSILGAQAKTKKATVARLMRHGMTKSQAKAWMH